jgi:hypothetical protein
MMATNQTMARALMVCLLASCGQLSLKGGASADLNNGAPASGVSSSEGDHIAGAVPAAAAAASGNAHDTFAVLDVKIGMAVEGRPGFTCTKQPADKDLEDTHCVKFLDSRCSGHPVSIGQKRYSEKAPLGCYLDYSNMATYLDGTLQQTANTGDNSDPAERHPRKPLMNLHIVGTQSKPSKIYRIWYTTAPDELAEDSKIYKAMVAKYGEPSYKNAPNEMRWRRDDTTVKAECDPLRQCVIYVEDSKFEDLERRKQEEADAKTRHQNAASPQL